MGSTESNAPGYAPDDEFGFDPSIDDFVSKERKYIHFDLPLSIERRTNFSFTRRQLLDRPFWPLLAYTQVERRVKYDSDGNFNIEPKEREIKFCSHTDAAILEWYTKQLSLRYEEYLSAQSYENSVLAYRSGVGNNISQAANLIEEIREHENVTAIAMDIRGFFDHIRHDVLRDSLRAVLNCDRLDEAHFKIFRRMTNFEFVESDRLAARLGRSKPVKGRICNAAEFRAHVRRPGESLVCTNPDDFAIPQGTPLSGLYANISLSKFDRKASEYANGLGGSYRRYSDDLAFLIPNCKDAASIVDVIEGFLGELGLQISPKKTDISVFEKNGDNQFADKPFQYLGFTYDGQRTLIRQSSLNRYYSKMHAGIRAKIRAAKNKDIPKSDIYMRQLLSRYTHLGKGRNFPRYAYHAAEVLHAPEIRRQLANHMNRFENAKTYYIQRAYG